MKKINLDVSLRVYSGNEIEKFKVGKKDKFSVLEDNYNVDVKREKNLDEEYLLVGFEDNKINVFSKYVYRVKQVSDVQDIFKVGFKKGWPILGFEEAKKYSKDLVSMEMSFEDINKILGNKFVRITKDTDVGFMVRKDQNVLVDFDCVDSKIIENLKADVPGLIESKCKYVTPVLSVFRHEVSYGVMSVEVETKESVKNQEISPELNSSGCNHVRDRE